ncbi:hypothetical protein [Deinococcus humi]|uniref:Uncharacterized protein n=1 Tax=Deinococcus humi TaxID=662880 RepID=A0A7W8JQZ5_9DEIO|nr:hypothetical protein [Deinococcus humi]MBB5361330.1 hypothetical protein [Deinococcus humi]GGO19507.1 hypothetical protein GCM10008949_03940 [Deinococcus humi]
MIPELHLSRRKGGPPALTVWGATVEDGVLRGGPFFVTAPLSSRVRLTHDGIKYRVPRLERGFYMKTIEMEAT